MKQNSHRISRITYKRLHFIRALILRTHNSIYSLFSSSVYWCSQHEHSTQQIHFHTRSTLCSSSGKPLSLSVVHDRHSDIRRMLDSAGYPYLDVSVSCSFWRIRHTASPYIRASRVATLLGAVVPCYNTNNMNTSCTLFWIIKHTNFINKI